eukprot:5453364-Pleurochrysis_carterae.AAC.1
MVPKRGLGPDISHLEGGRTGKRGCALTAGNIVPKPVAAGQHVCVRVVGFRHVRVDLLENRHTCAQHGVDTCIVAHACSTHACARARTSQRKRTPIHSHAHASHGLSHPASHPLSTLAPALSSFPHQSI